MAWAIQYQTLPFNGSWSYTFNFPGSVSSYIVGIPYFYFTFESSFHAVQQLGLNLETLGQLASAQEPTQIPVTVNATLSDASGTTIDLVHSSVTVAVIAWTGDANPQVMLGSATVNNGQSQSMAVPSETPVSGLLPILSGFELAYPSSLTNAIVESIEVGISASPQSQGFASLGGTTSMHDASGNRADGSGGSIATITGSLLATSLSSPGFIKQFLLQQQSGNPVSVNFGSQLDSAVALITGFRLQYSGHAAHYVNSIRAGTPSWSINGPIVVLSSAQALMTDTVYNQDNTASNVSLVVIGIPSS
jgi:hypothetical protein